MKIEIRAEFILIRGEKKLGIASIQIMPHDELPSRYTKCKEAVWGGRNSIVGVNSKGAIHTIMSEGDIIKNEEFRECLKRFRIAAKLLSEINGQLEKENGRWTGFEVFII